jgi:hypothetical protein
MRQRFGRHGDSVGGVGRSGDPAASRAAKPLWPNVASPPKSARLDLVSKFERRSTPGFPGPAVGSLDNRSTVSAASLRLKWASDPLNTRSTGVSHRISPVIVYIIHLIRTNQSTFKASDRPTSNSRQSVQLIRNYDRAERTAEYGSFASMFAGCAVRILRLYFAGCAVSSPSRTWASDDIATAAGSLAIAVQISRAFATLPAD